MIIYLANYNNYGNRLIKPSYNTVQGYIARSAEDFTLVATYPNYGFNPNDGVTTQIVLNYSAPTVNEPDYVLVAEDSGAIVSQWFIMDRQRTRKGQDIYSLRRNLIADFQDAIYNSMAYVGRGYCYSTSNLIYQNESFVANQIPTKEVLLKNRMETPWIVGYLQRSKVVQPEGSNSSFEVGETYDVAFQSAVPLKPIEQYTSWSEYPYSRFVKTADSEPEQAYFWYDNKSNTYSLGYGRLIVPNIGNPFYTQAYVDYNYEGIKRRLLDGDVNFQVYPKATSTTISTEAKPIYFNNMEDAFSYYDNSIGFNSIVNAFNPNSAYTLRQETGKVIQVNGVSYQLIFQRLGSSKETTTISKSFYPTLYSAMKDNLYEPTGGLTAIPNEDTETPFTVESNIHSGVLLAVEYSEELSTYNASFNYKVEEAVEDEQNVQPVTKDAIYEIIAAPLYDAQIITSSGTVPHQGQVALDFFNSLNTKYSESVIDVQIVPYCGIDAENLGADMYNLSSYQEILIKYDVTAQGNAAVAFKLPAASFNDILTAYIPTANSIKESVVFDMQRLVSPNGVGDFEYNSARNGVPQLGKEVAQQFEVSCTLIPFSPYIHIKPVWGGLYNNGTRYNGLICGGDFSIGKLNNSWYDFLQQNKYYQDIFNRQIDTMEIKSGYEYFTDITSAIGGTGSGVAGGAMLGATVGSVVPGLGTAAGAIVGGIAGGALSGASGIADIIINSQKRNREIADEKFGFSMNLKTIQAKPQSLTRSTSFNIDNAYFPYIEYYTGSDEEKDIYSYWRDYNGDTLGVYNYISSHINRGSYTYITATIVNSSTIKEDTHIFSEINRELSQGVRIDEYTI